MAETSAILEKLLQKKEQLAARIQKQQAIQKEKDRKTDTRQKIVIGGMVKKAMKCGELPETWLRDLIEKHATEKDKKLFDAWLPGGDWIPNETTMAAIEDARAGRNMSPVTIEELRGIAEAEAEANHADA